MKLLIIEDEKDMTDALKERLEKNYVVEVAYSGRKGLLKAQNENQDLIILDLTLPDIAGRDVCRQIRENSINTPILILTGRSDIKDRVDLLDCGADDYLLKPFDFPELLARLRALLRRRNMELAAKLLTAGDLTMNVTDRVVKRNGEIIHLRRKEFDILEYLLLNRGRLITRSMLLNHVWNSESEPYDSTVDVHIKYLRDRIDKPYSTKLIKTVHGMGYRIDS